MGLKPVSVSQLNNYIKRILQSDPILSNVTVIGEISNLKFHGSGHVYFSLKDEGSTVSCFLPYDVFARIEFELEEGKEIIVYGQLYLYERGGRYSINIRDVEESGEGRLMAQFKKLKKKLDAEGLFDPAHKKPIPQFPQRIAVVTSDSGAAVQDILKIIKSKNNIVSVLIYPVLVSGPNAAADIASAIDNLNRDYKDIDTIIVGRGGGSMEDLWAFNEEIVARSIYSSHIPIISAVGHEIDFTISDFVADKRAETPTAAADMAVYDVNALREYIDNTANDINRNLIQKLEIYRNKLETMNPENTIRELKARIAMDYYRCDNILEGLKASLNTKITHLESRVELAGEIIKASNPESILKRGYSIVRDNNNRIIMDGDLLSKGDNLTISFANGSAKVKVEQAGE